MKKNIIENLLNGNTERTMVVKAYKVLKDLKEVVKQEQKDLAQLIKELKSKRKGSTYGYVSGLLGCQEEYRRKHVAYCIFFNDTPYEAIESNTTTPLVERDYNPWFSGWKHDVAELWKKGAHNEDVCLSA